MAPMWAKTITRPAAASTTTSRICRHSDVVGSGPLPAAPAGIRPWTLWSISQATWARRSAVGQASPVRVGSRHPSVRSFANSLPARHRGHRQARRLSSPAATPSRLIVQRAAHGQAAALEDMGVDHGRLHVLMPEEFLHSADVVMRLQEMSGEGVARVWGLTRLGMPAACAAARMAFCKVFSWM